ncbi:hypothetical protein [Helicobacter cynogastricus]|uniref:hypothetical protein n=1 Tax=Helicobacter cynogastricus TaxID=329937 RepID=UPI001F220F41|nr:hypothetical protein [Helicobacter cynogastricus]
MDLHKFAQELASRRTLLYASVQNLNLDSSPIAPIPPKPALLKRMFGLKDYSQAEQILACAYFYALNDMVIYSHDKDSAQQAQRFGLKVQEISREGNKSKKKNKKKGKK